MAKALGVTSNAVHQHRHRHGISRPVCEAITVIITEPKPMFSVALHKGTKTWMIRVFGEPGREITLARFMTEVRLGRRLKSNERLNRHGRVVRGLHSGFDVMWEKNRGRVFWAKNGKQCSRCSTLTLAVCSSCNQSPLCCGRLCPTCTT